MDDKELSEMKARRAALDLRQKQARDQAFQLRAQADTLCQQRDRDKLTCAELDAKIQAEERARAAAVPQPKRVPHPEKPNVVVETVEVEKPLTWGRAAKKLFTGQ